MSRTPPAECKAAINTLLSSHFDTDSQDCVKTLIKLLDNILTKPNDPKVRSIRLANPAFHKRVGSRYGGVDFLLGCGFLYENEGGESVLNLPPSAESADQILSARHLLQSTARTLGMKDIPPVPKPIPPSPPTSAPSTSFDVYRTQSYNTSAAAHGANPEGVASLDGRPYASATERRLTDLQQKKEGMERNCAKRMSQADRGLVARRPGDGDHLAETRITAPAPGGGDGTLLAGHFKKMEDERRKREEGGFTTKAMRDLEKMKKAKVYSHTSLKIQFPSGHVLSGKFLPKETVTVVKQVIQECLSVSCGGFDLYVVPPRRVLEDKKSLEDLGLVPAAKVFVSWTESPPSTPDFLKAELFLQQSKDVEMFPQSKSVMDQKPKSNKAAETSDGTGGAAAADQKKQSEDDLVRQMMGKKRSGLGGAKKKGSSKLGGMPKWFKK